MAPHESEHTAHPTPTPVSAQVIQTIAAQLCVTQQVHAIPMATGSGNTIYALGSRYVLRVPHQHPPHAPVVQREVATVAAARAAGVQTPAVVLVDDSCQLLPVPFAVYERMSGIPLSVFPPLHEPPNAPWVTVGQQLAHLHTMVTADTAAGRTAPQGDTPDAFPWLRDLAQARQLAREDVTWLDQWLTRLAPVLQSTTRTAFCHGDVNASNILVDPQTGAYQALIDWGGVVWSDPAWDFVPVTLAAVPAMLAGYRSIARLPHDAEAEARILAYHLQLAVWGLRFRPKAAPDWARNRLARLRVHVAAFVQQPHTVWIARL